MHYQIVEIKPAVKGQKTIAVDPVYAKPGTKIEIQGVTTTVVRVTNENRD